MLHLELERAELLKKKKIPHPVEVTQPNLEDYNQLCNFEEVA